MIIFINEFIIKIIGHKKAQTLSTTEFDHLIDAQLESIKPQNLEGHVMIINVLPPTITRLFTIIKLQQLSHLQSITLIVDDRGAAEELIKPPNGTTYPCRKCGFNVIGSQSRQT